MGLNDILLMNSLSLMMWSLGHSIQCHV